MTMKKISEKLKKNKTEIQRETPRWVTDLRFGRSVSIEFFRHNAWLIMVFVVAVLSLIGLRYKTMAKMAQIKALNTELKRSESMKLQEKARYMSLIRETEMRRLVERNGLNLQFQEQPPYQLDISSRRVSPEKEKSADAETDATKKNSSHKKHLSPE